LKGKEYAMIPDGFITPHLETAIQFPDIEIKLDEIEVNILDYWTKPTLPREPGNYRWEWHYSISTDRGEDNDWDYDSFTCYINGDMFMKGEQYSVIKINTLHTYHTSPLKYKKTHDELYKMMARESRIHANIILEEGAKGTIFTGFPLPLEEDFLDEDASEWNKRGYLPKPAKPDENALGRKLSPAEVQELSAKINQLVKEIDAMDDRKVLGGLSEEDTREYYAKWAEWSKLSRLLWHFKLIARNHIAYMLDKMMRGMEKGMESHPYNQDAQEMYELMKKTYVEFMDDLKDEFAKN
jgi:hypothetical protein